MNSNTLKGLFLSVIFLAAASSVGCAGPHKPEESKPQLYAAGEELHLTRLEAHASISKEINLDYYSTEAANLHGTIENVRFLIPGVQEVDFDEASSYKIETTEAKCVVRGGWFSNLVLGKYLHFEMDFYDPAAEQGACKQVLYTLSMPVRVSFDQVPVTLTDGRKAIADKVILYINY
ncbi:hypothetical protein ACLSU7_17090 [Bdellovibrio sp. HCB185ZH]|uniref:hypothetical protein n=1 Tax=Bdellovibrio sp. HCB185ZH TaxID=3394235 RepID=UPI0039A4FED7